jgi:hypothetical protein
MAGSSAVRRRAIRGYAEKRAVKLFSQTAHQLKTQRVDVGKVPLRRQTAAVAQREHVAVRSAAGVGYVHALCARSETRASGVGEKRR